MPPFLITRALLLCSAVLILLVGCSGAPRTLPPGFLAERDIQSVESAPPEVMQAFEAGLNKEYLLGPGDVVEIVAPMYPEIAGEQTVSPEGAMTVYPVGGVQVGGLSRNDAEVRLKTALTKYFSPPSLTLRIKSFENNQVLVLGKVATPGAVKFRSRPNLLEALAKSGAFSPTGLERRITRCDIIRGKDQILHVSIDGLLKGGANGRNVDLANNDVIYIHENNDNNVYIMGEVGKPGAYEIRSSLSLLNAVMLAGGPTEDAVTSEIMLVREQTPEAQPLMVSFDRMVNSADYGGNVLLARNDIIFVPRRGMAKFNYYLRMLNPFTQMVLFNKAVGTYK